MMRSHPPHKLRRFVVRLVGIVIALVLLVTMPGRSVQNSAVPNDGRALHASAAANTEAALTTPKPTEEPKHSTRQKTKIDAAELSALADQLRDELNKLNVN